MSDSKQTSIRSGGVSGLGAKLSLAGLRTSKSNDIQMKRAPPVLQEVGRLAAGVAAVATGSATGNPRNKCALQPGHSLMDWIRLGSSGKDLTGVGANRAGTLSITPHQLAQHTQSTDAWIAIRGRVYNITHYLPFHPGGPEELMRGAGRDATKLFDQVHPWVNYEQILQKCLIGRLVSIDSDEDLSDLLFGTTSKKSLTKNQSNSVPTSPTTSTTCCATNKQLNKSSTSINESNSNCKTSNNTSNNIQLPKFDWIQKTESITFIFYTKAYSNCEIIVTNQSKTPSSIINVILIQLIYDNQQFDNCIELKLQSGEVKWPPVEPIRINYETGKCEFVFNKIQTTIWPTFGTIKQTFNELSVSVNERTITFILIDKIQLTHNTYFILLKCYDHQSLSITPIGKHIRLYIHIKDELHSRSYTPVPCALLKSFVPTKYSHECMCLIIKRYDEGVVSSAVCNLVPGNTVQISEDKKGGFRLLDLEFVDYLLLIVAGTGITPILNLVLFMLERRATKCQKIKLLFFNRTENDIIWRDQFDSLAKLNERFTVDYILSDVDSNEWQGKCGHINSDLVNGAVRDLFIDRTIDLSTSYVCICGPSAFTQISQQIMIDLSIDDQSFNSNQIYCFLG